MELWCARTAKLPSVLVADFVAESYRLCCNRFRCASFTFHYSLSTILSVEFR